MSNMEEYEYSETLEVKRPDRCCECKYFESGEYITGTCCVNPPKSRVEPGVKVSGKRIACRFAEFKQEGE